MSQYFKDEYLNPKVIISLKNSYAGVRVNSNLSYVNFVKR